MGSLLPSLLSTKASTPAEQTPVSSAYRQISKRTKDLHRPAFISKEKMNSYLFPGLQFSPCAAEDVDKQAGNERIKDGSSGTQAPSCRRKRGASSPVRGAAEARRAAWPASARQTPRAPQTHPRSRGGDLTSTSERIHLGGDQTKGKVGRIYSLDQPHIAKKGLGLQKR